MKRISFTALLGLLMALLAACGQQGTGSDTTGTQGSPAASAPVSSTAVEGSGAAGGALPDLGGRKVVIGTDATYPPMESVDRNSNQIVGFDVDLMNEIGKLINIKPEFQNAAFDTIFTALQSKQFDAVVSSATITDERKKIVAFSEPYIEVGQVVVVRADDTKINGAADLGSGALVGVQTGTTGEEAAGTEAKVADNNLKRYPTIDLAFAELANNTIDAVVADNPTVANYISQEQYKDKLKIVGEAFTTESYGIAVQQGDTELLNAINAALAQLKENGTIDQLKQKYNIK
ncbi:MAG TPA: basic amino acid ABC transporter substrate-binding protein [Herpetosiphonaceae bacterium]